MAENNNTRQKFPGWCKWLIGIVAAFLILSAATITIVVNLLKPEKLTALVEEYSPRFIDGEIDVKRIELTFWSTFPRLTLDIDSIDIISSVLKREESINPETFPVWTDSLLRIEKFKGSINLKKLLNNEIDIYDIVVAGPSANIVIGTEGKGNYEILKDTTSTNNSSGFKSIKFEGIKIINSGPLRYLSLSDTTFYEAKLENVALEGTSAPAYSIETNGNLKGSLLEKYHISNVRFAFTGGVEFDFESGLKSYDIKDFLLVIDSLRTSVAGEFCYDDSIRIKRLELQVDSLSFPNAQVLIQDFSNTDLSGIKTDATLSLSCFLLSPYTVDVSDFKIPDANIDISIPSCRIKGNGLNIDNFIFNAFAHINGNEINKSHLEIKRLLIDGQAIDLDLRALINQPVTNPRIAGEVKGRIFIDLLPHNILSDFPGVISGTVGLNTAFRFYKNQLNVKDFHKVYARGTMSLRNFNLRMGHRHSEEVQADSLILSTPLTLVHLQSDKSLEVNGVKIDSLLSLNITSDTLLYSGEGIDLNLTKFETSLGTRNVAGSTDTSQINPFGGTIKAEHLRLVSLVDSTRLSLREVTATGSLSRYQQQGKVPLLHMNIEARRINAGMPDMRVSVSRPIFDVQAHLIPKRQHQDSVLIQNADANENVTRRSGRQSHESRNPHSSYEQQDSLTQGIRQLLRRWDIKGNMSAQRARIFTPIFPINNTLRNLKLSFTTDSINLHSLNLKAGTSDFKITGEITGMKKSIGRIRRKEPLKIDFNITSDTINIDELSRAIFSGAAADKDTTLWYASVDDNMEIHEVINVDTTATAPLIIPADIDVTLNFKADNVIYTGLLFHNFSGELGAWDQAIHLHDLYAISEMGAIDVSALYNAPNVDDLEFGMGMALIDFHLERFLQVTPAISELLPAMKDFAGVINAEIALTTRLDDEMNFVIPSMQADVKIDGDSLVLLDADTFKTLSKWLFFKNKKRNMIDHMSVELQVDSSEVVIFPFIFNIDRYKLGVMGSNDLDMNFNYHVSVLKSPIPFKFGINISGNPDKYKIRLGGAKIKENAVVERLAINSDTRINLVNQLENVFRRGANASSSKAHIDRNHGELNNVKSELKVETDTLSESELETLNQEEGATNPE